MIENESNRQQIVDAEHLRLLRVGYFIAAATNGVWVFFPLLYVGMGVLMLSGAFHGAKPDDEPPRQFGIFMVAIGCAISLIMAAITVLKILSARAIGQRRGKTLVLITAAICCIGVPWGTALGVLTLLVLARPTVAAQFEGATLAADSRS